MTPQELAQKLKWDGNAILKFCLDALTDANFHSEVEKLEKLWEQMNHD